MIVKYKVSDFAKDLNLSTKKVLDELTAMGSTGKKNSSNLEENELNYLLEKFSKDNSVANLDEFLNGRPILQRNLQEESVQRKKRHFSLVTARASRLVSLLQRVVQRAEQLPVLQISLSMMFWNCSIL